METTDLQSLEHAALAAWPAREVQEHHGWWLRASDGVTKRANSATVLAPAKAMDQQITHCERFYAERQLPCILRLPSFVDHGCLDRRLADRGYQFLDLSLVLHRRLSVPQQMPDPAVQCLEQGAWLKVFAALSMLNETDLAGQSAILARIPGRVFAGVLTHQQVPVCAGLGVVAEGWFGIFDVITAATQRRQGFAQRLIQTLSAWAWQAGAREGYLQVVAANHAAIAVYEGLGYRRVYDYWYRIRPTS